MSVVVPCVKGKCLVPSTSTEFDSTHPTELAGIISAEEYQASIARINASLKRPRWTYRVQTIGRILLVLGIVMLATAGVKYAHMKHKHHQWKEAQEHAQDNNASNDVSIASDPAAPSSASASLAFSVQLELTPPSSDATMPPSPPVAEEELSLTREHDDEDDDDDGRRWKEEDEDKSEANEHGKDQGKKYKKHKKCIKHLFRAGLISFILGLALCRWIASKKFHQLMTAVIPAICAEHHYYTSSNRAVPVSWSLDERSICAYSCKNNRLKLNLDLHTTTPLQRGCNKSCGSSPSEKQMMTSASAYVPLETNEQA